MLTYALIVIAGIFNFFALQSNQDKVAGAIIVSAVGDALGRVTEFIDSSIKIQQKYGSQGVVSFADLKPYEIIDGKALYTDDTLMAKILLEEALNAKQNKLSDELLIGNYARRCAELFGDQSMVVDPYCYYRAHGPTNINAGQNLQALLHAQIQAKKDAEEKKELKEIDPRWWDRSQPNQRPLYYEIVKEGGCGSVMRAWPLGLLYGSDVNHLCSLADKQSQLTHRHPMARAASCAIAVGVAEAIQGASVLDIVHKMVSAAQQFDAEEKVYKPHAIELDKNSTVYDPHLIAKDQLLTSDMIWYAYQMAVQGYTPNLILGVVNQKQRNFRSPHGYLLGWSADEAVAAAVYVFVRHASNCHAALIEAVNTPGDSDSIATLAGALVGAYNGLESFKAQFDYSVLENKKLLLELASVTSKNNI